MSTAGGQLRTRLRERLPDVIEARGELTAMVDPDDLLAVLRWCRDDLGFAFLSSVTATDWPDRTPRFWLAYELRCIDPPARVRVKVGADGQEPHVPSVTSLYPTADWHERETFDFYGIVFDGHPRLTRILLPDDWDGYPLRKTESLGGVPTRFHGAFLPPIDERTS